MLRCCDEKGSKKSREITFFSRFEQDILAGRKTITIRDASESHFEPGEVLRVSRNEDGVFFCFVEVLSVTPVRLDALTERHAQQENMSLGELKQVIKEIYPGLDALFVIEFVKR
jgi:uncharacterized protein YqfB (UPF0267 family)